MDYLKETIEKITEFLKEEAKTETIIGKEFKLGEFSCVPVMSLGLGFGGGGGEGKGKTTEKSKGEGEGEAAGAAGGLGITPLGFLVSKGSNIQFIASKPTSGLNTAMEKLPDLLEKYFESNRKREKESV